MTDTTWCRQSAKEGDARAFPYPACFAFNTDLQASARQNRQETTS
ncbi:hypothetical protein [Halomonas salinarum]|nr:hypothetical protein [Halomonas salinarum]